MKQYSLTLVSSRKRGVIVQYIHERTQPKERKEKTKRKEVLMKIAIFLLLEFLLMYYLVKQIPDAITALIAVILVSFSYMWIKYLRFFK